jgi:hypothetical protein
MVPGYAELILVTCPAAENKAGTLKGGMPEIDPNVPAATPVGITINTGLFG